jgi:hypothetical protein
LLHVRNIYRVIIPKPFIVPRRMNEIILCSTLRLNYKLGEFR